MINKVYEILIPLNLPTKWQIMPEFGNKKSAISYHFFNQGGELYLEGKPVEEGGALQVDIFSKVDYSSVVKEAKRLLANAHFLCVDSRDDIETLDSNTVVYHKILIFNYSESEVLMNG